MHAVNINNNKYLENSLAHKPGTKNSLNNLESIL